MQFTYTASTGMMFPTAFAFINRAAEGWNRGQVNGWANSSGALCRAAFPPASAVLLTLSAGAAVESSSSGVSPCARLGLATRGWGPLGRYVPLYIVSLIAAICVAAWCPLAMAPLRQAFSLRGLRVVNARSVNATRLVAVSPASCDQRREPLMDA